VRFLIQKESMLVVLSVTAVGTLYYALGYDDLGPASRVPALQMPVTLRNRSLNCKLADDFIRWYQAQHVDGIYGGWGPQATASSTHMVNLPLAGPAR
jgi:hypothetical protein